MKKIFLGIIIGAILVCCVALSIVFINKDNNIRIESIKAYKASLLDEVWVKDNLYMKKNCFNEDIKSDAQALTFKMIDMGYNAAPIILVNAYIYETEAETDNADFGNQVFILKYENANVVIETLNDVPAHPGHVNFIVSEKYKTIGLCYMHMGICNNEIYNIEDKLLLMSYGYNEEIDKKGNLVTTYKLNDNEISESVYKSLALLSEKNCLAIDTELTKENIESIIK